MNNFSLPLLPDIKKVWDHIVDRYKPGSKLPPEPALAQELMIGRHKLREALKYLESLGVIERRPRAGTTVKEVDATSLSRQVLDLMDQALPRETIEGYDLIREARAVLEGAVAFLATINRAPKDMVAMGTAILDLESIRKTVEKQGIQATDVDAWIAADKSFHDSILAAAHNPHLLLFGKIIVASFASKTPPNDVCIGNKAESIIKEHKDIFESINKGVIFDKPQPDFRHARSAMEAMFRHIIHPKESSEPFALHLRPWAPVTRQGKKKTAE